MDVGTPSPLVEIAHLRVSYGPIDAVRGVDLTVAPGELVALLGPNGAGKSTLMNAVLGLVPATSGTVRVAGRTPRRAVRRGDVGAMLQVASLPEGAKVGEVISLVRALHRNGPTVDQLLEFAGLRGLAGREVSTLSGGQAQRVRFAAALAGRPQLLVLDEPTTGMDVESRNLFWDAVRGVADDGSAVLFATHYVEEADRFADRVIVMAAGQVVAQGAPAELKAARTEVVLTVVTDHPEDVTALTLPGATTVDTRGSQLRIHTTDPDGTLRVLHGCGVRLHVADFTSSELSDVFLAVTASRTEH